MRKASSLSVVDSKEHGIKSKTQFRIPPLPFECELSPWSFIFNIWSLAGGAVLEGCYKLMSFDD